jgi:hypothetical protein
MGRSLWQEDGSVVYNCYWPLPAQSFSGPSPVGLMAIFYCLRFETPRTWRTRSLYLYPPGTGWRSYTPRHWAPFSSPPTTSRATEVVFDPVSTRFTESCSCPASFCNLSANRIETTASNSCHSIILFVVTGTPLLIFVAAETGVCVPLPSNLPSASDAVPAFSQCLPSRWLENRQMPHNMYPFHAYYMSYPSYLLIYRPNDMLWIVFFCLPVSILNSSCMAAILVRMLALLAQQQCAVSLFAFSPDI